MASCHSPRDEYEPPFDLTTISVGADDVVYVANESSVARLNGDVFEILPPLIDPQAIDNLYAATRVWSLGAGDVWVSNAPRSQQLWHLEDGQWHGHPLPPAGSPSVLHRIRHNVVRGRGSFGNQVVDIAESSRFALESAP